VLEHRALSTALGVFLVAVAVLMIFLNAFGVISGAVQILTYVVMGLGLALFLVPRMMRQPLDDEEL
jgi:hypothetical protein